MTHRVDNVGAEDEVETPRLELLTCAGALEIEGLELDFRKRGELLPRGGEERRGDIAEGVGMATALQ